VERLREVLRLKELLGVSLDELGELLEAVTARGVLRDEWQRGPEPERGRETASSSSCAGAAQSWPPWRPSCSPAGGG